jgi:hypothetical protein
MAYDRTLSPASANGASPDRAAGVDPYVRFIPLMNVSTANAGRTRSARAGHGDCALRRL